MQLERLQIYCGDCDSWYDASLDHNLEVCANCGGNLSHAHETGQQTPYMVLRAELIRQEIEIHERRIHQLRDTLVNECWDED